MFEKKSSPTGAPKTEIPVSSIPAEFYGGKNPVVKFKIVEREVRRGGTEAGISVADKKMLDKATAAGSGRPLHPANLFSNRKFLLISGAVLFILVVAGVSWYYWRQATAIQPAPALPPPVITPPPAPAVEAPAPVSPPVETPTTTVAPQPPSLAESLLIFPSTLLGDTGDTEHDGLTDNEEELYKTDPNNPDTDGDGFSDSHELFYLYSPIEKEPAKLIDAGLVKDYSNPAFNYKIFYPASWAVGNVDDTYRDVLFSTLTGENIEVRVIDKESGQTFSDWFAKWAPDQKFADLTEFVTVSKDSGWQRSDNLVYYFEDSQHVYTVIYHNNDLSAINYRATAKTMAHSFRLSGSIASVVIPSVGVTLPVSSTPATATTSL